MAKQPLTKSKAARISCIVLAAGTSSRMGNQNKLLLPWKEERVIHTVIQAVAAIEPFEIIVVTSELTRDHLPAKPFMKIVENPDYKTGMTSSIQVGVSAASIKADGYMICLGDQPTLQIATYEKIMDTFSGHFRKQKQAITVPYFREVKGNPVVFSSWYKQEILDHRAPEGCREIIQTNRKYLHKVEVDDESILLDIDTPEKYKEIKKRFLGSE